MSSHPEKTALEGFPTTQPAIKIKFGLADIFACDDICTGSTLVCAPFSQGTIESIEGFEPKLDLKVSHGNDWFRIDPDKKHGHASVSAMATDAEGSSIRLIAEGIVELNEHTMPVIFGHPDAKSNPFGYAIEHMRFECGHEPYKALEFMLFAGSVRFIKEESGLFADIRLSRIIAGSGYE